jgi:lipoprotein-anchoring transpeptidase ErfK/SrfK
MGRKTVPNILAKLGLAPHRSRLHVAGHAAAQSVLPQMITMTPVKESAEDAETTAGRSPLDTAAAFLRRHRLGTAAIITLIVGTAILQIGGTYWTSHKIRPIVTSSAPRHRTAPLRGPNMAIPASQLAATLQQITGQQINLVIGSRTVPVDSTTIKSWLHIVTDKKTQTAYIHLNESEIGPSIGQLTSRFAKSPVNQVTVTHPDGTQAVIVGGRDGVNVGDTGALAKQLAPNVLSGKGTQFNIPLQTVPFQAVSATSFDKLIEVNVVSKQMYLYDKGNFTRQYPISAGAPATPTPLGQFKVYSKLPLQDMKGFNPDGSKYFQPNVRWISYFKAGGYAVHGNYWRPTSWFGAINSSHGCVSLPEDQAKVVYDWTTIGTTVIVHT